MPNRLRLHSAMFIATILVFSKAHAGGPRHKPSYEEAGRLHALIASVRTVHAVPYEYFRCAFGRQS